MSGIDEMPKSVKEERERIKMLNCLVGDNTMIVLECYGVINSGMSRPTMQQLLEAIDNVG